MTDHLAVDGLELSFGTHQVLNKVTFSIAEGERLCLLGPSGCGKTTTLQVIAGFIQAQTGSVMVAGRPIDHLPPEKRNIGIMFQNYALFPHMTIFDNVAFGLRMRRLPAAEVEQRVGDALRLVRLAHAAQKSPRQLSGGEQQRIAFARAVAIRPNLLLLDEPFSNLDARLRIEMRDELLHLLRPLRIATLMVTHDQEEAMAIADRVAVMRAGRIEQIGTPQAVYSQPANLFVAHFVGESNVLDGTVQEGGAAGTRLEAPGLGSLNARACGGLRRNDQVKVLVRPERISLLPAGAVGREPGWNYVPATLDEVVFLGHRTECRLLAGARKLTAWQAGGTIDALRLGDPVIAAWRHDDTLVVPQGAA
ncbi:MAG: ABC transporter ATP-binding protein [Rhodospirillales bacterium]|nr:ABC transporter ATP-binding protein [Rhodospirillales bacterium]